MRVELDKLFSRLELSSKDWHLPHVRPISETLESLYSRPGVSIFVDASHWDRDPSYNVNQVAAADELFETLRTGEGGIAKVEGSMFSGKDSVLKLVRMKIQASRLEGWGVSVLENEIGWRRHQSEFLQTHWERENNRRQAVQVRIDYFPKSFPDVLDILSRERDKKIFLVGEAQFFMDQGAESEESWQNLSSELKRQNRYLVLFGLNLTYRGEPWELTKATSGVADKVFLLVSRCEGQEGECQGPGLMTSRMIKRPNGWRPASTEDPTVVVAGNELYEACCSNCFQLLTPEQAQAFDAGG